MLVKEIHILREDCSTELDMKDEMLQMILDTWIEEILKFSQPRRYL